MVVALNAAAELAIMEPTNREAFIFKGTRQLKLNRSTETGCIVECMVLKYAKWATLTKGRLITYIDRLTIRGYAHTAAFLISRACWLRAVIHI